jgi:hypothetical protein
MHSKSMRVRSEGSVARLHPSVAPSERTVTERHARFESRPRHWLFWLRLFVVLPSCHILTEYLYLAHNRLLQDPTSCFIHYVLYFLLTLRIVLFLSRISLVRWGTVTSRKVAGSIPYEVIGLFDSPNPSSRTMALGSTQPLTEMSTRNLARGKGRPGRKADLTSVCEPIF